MVLTEETVSWLCSYSIMVCVISAFDVQCPHSSHRQILAKVFCNGSEISKYSCLYDINNHVYTESCNRLPDFVRPGKRYVFMGSRTGIDCSSERYQPFKFWSNELSDCVYQKSLCNEIGQKTYQRRSTKEDNTCSCDYNKGYGFVIQPKHIQYCIPSKEDCSCYLVQCADNNTLSSDYKCKPGLKQKNENNSTENMDTRDIKPSISDKDDGMVVDGRHTTCIIILIICCIVIDPILVIVSIIAIKINPSMLRRSNRKRSVPAGRGDAIAASAKRTIRNPHSTVVSSTSTTISGSSSISSPTVAPSVHVPTGNQANRQTSTVTSPSLGMQLAPAAVGTPLTPSALSAADTCSSLVNQSGTAIPTQSQSEQQIVNIIAENRSFLIEEIPAMTLVTEFKKEKITCFDGLKGNLSRKEMAEEFCTILEKNSHLLHKWLEILHEKEMIYVLDRLNNWIYACLADPQILKRNIVNNSTQILDKLDIDDVKEIFIERNVFNSSMFDEIKEKYSRSEDQMSTILTEIIISGPRAMRILVNAVYINALDSLANSLLVETANELQEIQDNTQIDESSSDGELLYKRSFVVSKADE